MEFQDHPHQNQNHLSHHQQPEEEEEEEDKMALQKQDDDAAFLRSVLPPDHHHHVHPQQQPPPSPKSPPPSTWLDASHLRRPRHNFSAGSPNNFLHLQTSDDHRWLSPHDSTKKNPVREENCNGEMQGWERDKCKADVLNHPLYDQLLAAHVSCLRIATPVDQLPRIDAQLAQSQSVVSKYSLLAQAHPPLDDRDLDLFMVYYSSLFHFLNLKKEPYTFEIQSY
ncbi:unnamed protein product [Cuscuta campestris]|uniref:KNOX1 domain-containing protein n=1 Tax=Cuscuta campestris TaxID=132261 RepID=A0A484KDT7_9ASTE|nr:unnamed protein product [Cuscuta campestris]